MLKRKIEAELLAWKQRQDKMCLVIKGARQVGKSGQVKHGIKLSSKNIGGTEQVDSYPLYMAMFI